MSKRDEWWAAFRVIYPKVTEWHKRNTPASIHVRFISEEIWNYWSVPYP